MTRTTHYTYKNERDDSDPFGGAENEMHFARQYLERANQGSSIYFTEQSERGVAHAGASDMRHIVPHPSAASMIWRLAWLCAAGGTIAMALFIGAHGIPGGTHVRAQEYADAYGRIAAAHTALFSLRIDDAATQLRSVRAERKDSSAPSSRIASVIAAASALLAKDTAPPSTLDAVLADVVARSAASIAPLADLSFNSFFHAEAGAATAGDIVERALGETKNAEEAVANAHRALSLVRDGDASLAALHPRLSLIAANMKRYEADLTLASWALGTEYARRFLIVVQDQTTARATGGIIRSLGIITLQKGAITDSVFDAVHVADGQLQTNIIPPDPIKRTAVAWTIRDANWFPDFPMSARTIADFYQKSSGKNVDGVIAVNGRMLEKLLIITGPVAGKEGALVNAHSGNIAADPAAISAMIGVLPSLFGTRAADAAQVIVQSLAEKDALIWVADRDYENAVRAKGWGGEVAEQSDADYFSVAASDIEGGGNIGMSGAILKEAAINEKGEAVNDVVVEYGAGAAGKKLRYLRIYTPLGSELLDASGGILPPTAGSPIDYVKEHFARHEYLADSERTMRHDDVHDVDVFEESGKTVFGIWLSLDEKGGRAAIRYAPPLSVSPVSRAGVFAATFQKQPGMDMTLHFSVIPSGGARVLSADGFTGDFHGALADQSFTMTVK